MWIGESSFPEYLEIEGKGTGMKSIKVRLYRTLLIYLREMTLIICIDSVKYSFTFGKFWTFSLF